MTRRVLVEPFVVGPPRAVSTRTRVFPSDVDEVVLREIGDHLGGLLRSDLAERCRLGTGSKHLGRAKRKRSVDFAVFFSLGGCYYPGGGRYVGEGTAQPRGFEGSGMAGRSPSWIAVSFYRSVRVKAKSADTRPDPSGSRSNAAGRYWLPGCPTQNSAWQPAVSP